MKLLQNPRVTVEDYKAYHGCSDATAKRLRAADFRYATETLGIRSICARRLRVTLEMWMHIYSTPPPALESFVINN